MNKCKIRRVTLILAGAAVAFACFWRDEPIVVQAEGVPEIERLRAPSIREGDVAVLRDCADRNEILNELFSREDVPEALVPELCRLAGDPSQDAVWRDYCLQFLGVAFQRFGTNPFVGDEMALSTLRAALSSREDTFAGTALLSFRKAATARRDEKLRRETSAAALKLASSSDASDRSRVTALLLLEEIRHPEVSSIASRIAASRQSGYLAETSSAVLGRAGVEK